jgi:hypothetical protein
MSTFEASSAPDWTMVVLGAAVMAPLSLEATKVLPGPAPRASGAGTSTSVSLPTDLPAAVTVPSGPRETAASCVPAGRRIYELAAAEGEAALAVEAQGAVAGEGGAPVGQLDLDEPGTDDRHVQRLAGGLQRARGRASTDHRRRGTRAALHARRAARSAGLLDQVAKRHTLVLVARGADVGEVI